MTDGQRDQFLLTMAFNPDRTAFNKRSLRESTQEDASASFLSNSFHRSLTSQYQNANVSRIVSRNLSVEAPNAILRRKSILSSKFVL